MEKKRVLIVTQEMQPYIGHTDISQIVRDLSQHVQEDGMDIRVLMPKYGNINERRHRLHEVVRLSGINISVNDDDYPLIIKVGSLPGTRMQVYFLDNEDLFKRKGDILDEKNKKFYEDNAERMAFFCKGVMEIIKKFGWAPDIIHCHGWMTSLVPLYAKTAYKDEPVFKDSKIVYSVYKEEFFDKLNDDLNKMASINGSVSESELANFNDVSFDSLNKGAATFADALIDRDGNKNTIDDVSIPTIEHSDEEGFVSYKELYDTLLD